MAWRDRRQRLRTRSEAFPIATSIAGCLDTYRHFFSVCPRLGVMATYCFSGCKFNGAEPGEWQYKERRGHLCHGSGLVWFRSSGRRYNRVTCYDSKYQYPTAADRWGLIDIIYQERGKTKPEKKSVTNLARNCSKFYGIYTLVLNKERIFLFMFLCLVWEVLRCTFHRCLMLMSIGMGVSFFFLMYLCSLLHVYLLTIMYYVTTGFGNVYLWGYLWREYLGNRTTWRTRAHH